MATTHEEEARARKAARIAATARRLYAHLPDGPVTEPDEIADSLAHLTEFGWAALAAASDSGFPSLRTQRAVVALFVRDAELRDAPPALTGRQLLEGMS